MMERLENLPEFQKSLATSMNEYNRDVQSQTPDIPVPIEKLQFMSGMKVLSSAGMEYCVQAVTLRGDIIVNRIKKEGRPTKFKIWKKDWGVMVPVAEGSVDN